MQYHRSQFKEIRTKSKKLKNRVKAIQRLWSQKIGDLALAEFLKVLEFVANKKGFLGLPTKISPLLYKHVVEKFIFF